MAKIDWVETRLLNWARWKAAGAGGGLGYASGSMLTERVDQSRYRESVIPVDSVDADVTDQAVKSLERDLLRTVQLLYVQDAGVKQGAKLLGISERAVAQRIDVAHAALARWFNDRQERQRAAKQLTEAQAHVRAVTGAPVRDLASEWPVQR